MATKKKKKENWKTLSTRHRGYTILINEHTDKERVDWKLKDPKGKACSKEDSGFDATQTQAIQSAKDCVDMILDDGNTMDDDYNDFDDDEYGEHDDDDPMFP